MAWNVIGNYLQICEGDFGIGLPATLHDAQMGDGDAVKLTIKTAVDGETIIEKIFDNIVENTFEIKLTAAESALLPIGEYVYAVDWYHDGEFLCNIVPSALFKVVNKA